MHKLSRPIAAWFLPLALAVRGLAAAPQEESSGQEGEATAQESAGNPSEIKPDTRPLSGITELTVGTIGPERSYLVPDVSIAEAGDTNSQIVNNTGNFVASTVLAGHIGLQMSGKRNQAMLTYTGAGIVSVSSVETSSSSFHNVGLIDVATWRHWRVQVGDQMNYTPETTLGSVDRIALGLSQVGSGAQQGPRIPGQSPFFSSFGSVGSGFVTQWQNSVTGEIEYIPSARSSVTASGAYEILRSDAENFIQGNSSFFSLGYDRLMTEKDTLGVSYGASYFTYLGSSYTVYSNRVGVNYGRRITGRLAFRGFVGPQVATSYGAGIPATQRTIVGAEAALTYQLERTHLQFSYSRGVGSGLGIQQGTDMQRLNGSLDRQLSRTWSIGFDGGYSRNTQLVPLSSTAAVNHPLIYITGGARISRRWGRYSRVFAFYNYENQHSKSVYSIGNFTGNSLNRNVFGVGITWGFHPIGI